MTNDLSSPMQRITIASGAVWESVVGYSRAVRVGPHVAVAGTTAGNPDGSITGGEDIYAQTLEILKRIEYALQQAGAAIGDVVRTRMFVTDIDRWRDVARAHSEFFDAVRPAATMVEVARLIDPGLLIEIEVDAIISAGEPT